MHAPALPACGALRDSLEDPDVETRLAAAHALYDIRFETARPVEVSADVLRNDPDPRNRKMAVWNLAVMAEAPAAMKALEPALADTDEQVRNRAEELWRFAHWLATSATSDRQRRR